MAGLQRSAVSFRRQGSSGSVWDDRFLAELNKAVAKEAESAKDQKSEEIRGSEEGDRKTAETAAEKKSPAPINTLERSRSNGGARGHRTGRVSPAIEPPSPKVSACGFCGAFGKPASKNRRKKPLPPSGGKRRSR